LSKKYIVPVFIFYLSIFINNCTSAESKSLSPVDNSVVLQKVDVAKNVSSGRNSGKKRPSDLIKPSDFHPDKPEIITFNNNEIEVTLYARKFAQGNCVYAEIEKKGGVSDLEGITFTCNNIKIPVTKTSWGFRSFWGIDPEEKPGYEKVIINYRIDGKEMALESEIKIRDVDYPVSKSMLNVGKFSDKTYTGDQKFKDLIAECSALRKKAFGTVSEDSIESTLAHPRDMHKITGDYWRKRIYLSYQKKGKKKRVVEGKKSFHRGLDLKGAVGAPVFAIADGTVVLSHTMFYEGNMVVVDHGNQMFSYYQHMDSRKVKDGDRVRAGDVLGGVGATGMVTGPHLHIALSIRGVHVDPLSILSLPVSR